MNSSDSMTCAAFEDRLSDYLENILSANQRALMDAHMAGCSNCAALLADLRELVSSAATLPLLTPSHDLWPAIAAQIDASVTPIAIRQPAKRTGWTFSVRQFAAAAVALVTVSSGATYMLTHATAGSSPARADSIAKPVAVGSTDSLYGSAASTQAVSPADSASRDVTRNSRRVQANDAGSQLASYSSGAAERTYEREIGAMRRIVDERLDDLDSATVVEIERNLAIIDKAIADSRRALAKDPRSGFLSTQLDRALEIKLATLRKVALL